MIDQELARIRDSFLKNQGAEMDIVYLNSDSISSEDLISRVSNYSLFGGKQLYILRRPFQIEGFEKEAAKIGEVIPDATMLVIVDPKTTDKSKQAKLLRSIGTVRVYNSVKGGQLERWIIDYVKEKGGKVDLSNARHLIERVGEDDLAVKSEIDKLMLYDKEISRETIDQLVDKSAQSVIFNLLDSAFTGHPKYACELYEDQIRSGAEPEYVLNMLAWQMSLIAACKTAKSRSVNDISSDMKISSYSLGKAMTQSSRLEITDIRRIIARLAEMDISSKTGEYELSEAIKNFLLDP